MNARGRWLEALLLTLLSAGAAADLTNIYDEAELQYWAGITPTDIQGVYDESIRPVLTENERRQLDAVALRFPLHCPAPAAEPFCYFTTTEGGGAGVVVMSVASLRLFGDLALATSWLQLNGYAIDTPVNYLTMLKYREAREFPGGRYPRPLETLGIPGDVRADAEVMELYGKLYTSAVVFVLLHELGHALHRHPGYGPGVDREAARANEAEADAFALDVMARLAYPPLGMVSLFTLMTHWEPNRWNFPSRSDYEAHLRTATHPLTADRLRQLAGAVRASAPAFARAEPDYPAALARMEGIAGDIEELAEFMDDPDIQAGIVLLGQAIGPAALKPHRPRELSAPATPGTASVPFAGRFHGHISDASGSLPTILILQRQGNLVSGLFTYGLGMGRITGEIRGGRLFFGWQIGASHGSGVFDTDAAGNHLSGHWGHGRSSDNGGRWEARREVSGEPVN